MLDVLARLVHDHGVGLHRRGAQRQRLSHGRARPRARSGPAGRPEHAEVLDEDVGVLVEHGLQAPSRAVLEHPLPVSLLVVHSAQHRRDVRLVEERPEPFGDLARPGCASYLSVTRWSPAGHSRQRAQRRDRGTGDRVQGHDLGEIRRRTSRDRPCGSPAIAAPRSTCAAHAPSASASSSAASSSGASPPHHATAPQGSPDRTMLLRGGVALEIEQDRRRPVPPLVTSPVARARPS